MDNDFYIFAVKCTQEPSSGKRKLVAGKAYYLVDGFTIAKDGSVKVDKEERLKSNSLYSRYLSDADIAVNISAIVGKNGSGKSSIVEYMIRLINNFATMLFGEDFISPSADHLHYIDGMHGELYFVMKGKMFVLSVEDFVVTLHQLVIDPADSGYYIRSDGKYCCIQKDFKLPRKVKINSILGKGKTYADLKKFFENFFYTVVVNYSIYAYNSQDFTDEMSDLDLEHSILKGERSKIDYDKRSWLRGIFHKNDGYQTPLVLTPMRNKGIIDINNENELGHERLLLLLFLSPEYQQLNNHLRVSSIEAKPRTYDNKFVKKSLSMWFTYKGYEVLKRQIAREWGIRIGYDLMEVGKDKTYYQAAINYLAFKTIKISSNYRQYNKFYDKSQTKRSKFDLEELHNLIEALSKDRSHITAKIRRTLMYLTTDIYSGINGECKKFVPEDVAKKIELLDKVLREGKNQDGNIGQYYVGKEDFLPPPFLGAVIHLMDGEDRVEFSSLSSGERQQAYSVSSILYHLKNLDSVWLDDNAKRICHHSVLIILEEIELYYHPELQQQLIMNILNGLRQVKLPNIKAVNFIFVTHSPYILSDIHSDYILALDDNKGSKPALKTFGANIHDILNTGFFMNRGAMGDYVRSLVGEMVDNLIAYKEENAEPRATMSKEELKEKIQLIEEPILRYSLLDEYYRIFDKTLDEVDAEKQMLLKRIEELDNMKKGV